MAQTTTYQVPKLHHRQFASPPSLVSSWNALPLLFPGTARKRDRRVFATLLRITWTPKRQKVTRITIRQDAIIGRISLTTLPILTLQFTRFLAIGRKKTPRTIVRSHFSIIGSGITWREVVIMVCLLNREHSPHGTISTFTLTTIPWETKYRKLTGRRQLTQLKFSLP